ncbi:hypothetical protein [Stenotrophomonas sp. BIGb0135]|uniref:hypothetical protein n=1 Tax=Stenotrophomonas sp. BIGb0135 TaxID=2940620 RepID=UPI0021699794|nr:hypothetical protein [Stenotrophomonas sp. BIGb0135]MCS4235062.1 hypothetical protein [Stenotrophomonas sp. BIGb0135]MCS4235117.1 hypothetical protein [Stenotrophomonas sp. BIGb0135]
MANATDARISVALPGHPKTKKLARRLGAAGPLYCIYLFLWATANRSDGDLAGMTDEDIELAIDWTGEEFAFVRGMAEAGFLDGEEGNRRIHDWDEHNPWAAGAASRSQKAKWANLCKYQGKEEAERKMPAYAKRLRDASKDASEGSSKDGKGSNDGPIGSPTGDPIRSGNSDVGTPPYPSPIPSPSPLPNPSPEDEPTVVGLSAAGGGAAADDRGTDGGNDSQDLLGKVPRKNGQPPCPHLKIIDLYHEILPELTEVRVWEGDRERKLAARWKSDAERQSLDWWRAFFGSVREMPFLMGERTGRDGRAFTCTLEWLVSPKNFAKVIEGNYLDVRR